MIIIGSTNGVPDFLGSCMEKCDITPSVGSVIWLYVALSR